MISIKDFIGVPDGIRTHVIAALSSCACAGRLPV